MIEVIPDFNGLDDYYTIKVYDAAVVPDEEWAAAREVQYESLKSLLPRTEWNRVETLVDLYDFDRFRETHANRNVLVGHGRNDRQIYRKQLFTGVYNISDQLVAGISTERNTSARLPYPSPFWQLECWAKMLIRPGIPVPAIGNRRHIHLDEVYSHPDEPGSFRLEDEGLRVSKLVLAGLFFSLLFYNKKESLVAYEVPTDKADAELVHTGRVLGMKPGTWNRAHPLEGYIDDNGVRAVTTVGGALERIQALPQAESLGRILAFRVTNAGDKQIRIRSRAA